MVTPSLLHWLPLGPRKLRYLAALFISTALAAFLAGCTAGNSFGDSGDPAAGLRGLALATRPAGHIASDPAQPQRHPRQSPLSTARLTPAQHHPAANALYLPTTN